jgi:hypothetical protein
VSIHDRNRHNLNRELEHEAIGIRLNEVIVDILEDIKISGSTYPECYRELIEKFRQQVRSEGSYSLQAYLKEMLDGMEVWADACNEILY